MDTTTKAAGPTGARPSGGGFIVAIEDILSALVLFTGGVALWLIWSVLVKLRGRRSSAAKRTSVETMLSAEFLSSFRTLARLVFVDGIGVSAATLGWDKAYLQQHWDAQVKLATQTLGDGEVPIMFNTNRSARQRMSLAGMPAAEAIERVMGEPDQTRAHRLLVSIKRLPQ